MVFDFRRKVHTHEVTLIKGQAVECVQSYKYLGTIIDSKLDFNLNCEAVCKRGHQRLSCLRKLSRLNIDRTIMILFYRAFIESVLTFSLVAWFGNLALKNRNSLNLIVKWSSRLIGEPQSSLESLYNRQLDRITSSILRDRFHPLNREFQLLPSGHRFAVPKCRTKRYRSTFVPAAIVRRNKL